MPTFILNRYHQTNLKSCDFGKMNIYNSYQTRNLGYLGYRPHNPHLLGLKHTKMSYRNHKHSPIDLKKNYGLHHTENFSQFYPLPVIAMYSVWEFKKASSFLKQAQTELTSGVSHQEYMDKKARKFFLCCHVLIVIIQVYKLSISKTTQVKKRVSSPHVIFIIIISLLYSIIII